MRIIGQIIEYKIRTPPFRLVNYMISVLYVDDEPGVLEIGKLFIEQGSEFSVDTAISAPEALDTLQNKKYEVILSDYAMPEMNGIAFLKALRESNNNLPFILFTGRGREEVVIEALNNGADFYIQKGGDPTAQFADLANKIRHAVTQRRYQEELGISEIMENEMKYHERELLKYLAELKLMEEAVQSANQKLNLLNRIVRHDILNTITGLMGLEDMLGSHISGEEAATLLREIKDCTRRIQHQINFTRDYQEIGVQTPQWQNVHDVISSAARQANPASVHLCVMPQDDLEIFADSMLEKVFYNLIDNALRYGGNLSTITITSQKNGDTIVICCQDDGGGIAEAEKEKIFESGFGKNTGQGLFLVREILQISGISIKENGCPGTGARFELHVPEGTWRFAQAGCTEYPPGTLSGYGGERETADDRSRPRTHIDRNRQNLPLPSPVAGAPAEVGGTYRLCGERSQPISLQRKISRFQEKRVR